MLTISRMALGAATISFVFSFLGCSQLPTQATAIQMPATQGMAPAPLSIRTYVPSDGAIFTTPSTLITGKHDAILIDAQFSADDAHQVVEQIRSSGKQLKAIYISHWTPEYYFGLDTLKSAFPDVKVFATPQTNAHIRDSGALKMKVWGPQLGVNAPKRLIMPTPLPDARLRLEGQNIRIIGLDGPTPDRTFVWIPSLRVIVGGVLITAGEHVWMADTQTRQSRLDWLDMLDRAEALGPAVVIPGHYLPGSPLNLQALQFTRDYIKAFDEEAERAANSVELIAAMKARYPGLRGEGTLDLSAKVAKGEMQWP